MISIEKSYYIFCELIFLVYLKEYFGGKMELIIGNIVNIRQDYSLEVLRKGSVAIGADGKITDYGFAKDLTNKYPNAKCIEFEQAVIMPGLIDIHSHLPQFFAMGLGAGELLPWLNNRIFPQEAKFANTDFAQVATKIYLDEMVSKGTTTAVLYAAAGFEPADIAFEYARELGISCFIGNTMMDQNVNHQLLSSKEDILKVSEKLLNKWHGSGRLQYVVTPRFAISCSFELMQAVASLAKSNGLFVQTHLSENKQEISTVREMYPDYNSYLDVYEKSGIIGEKSIFAHSIYLEQAEIETLKSTGSVIAHCPTSNRYLSSGIMPAKVYLSKGMKIALGTDVAAGYSLSILHEAKEAVESSKILKAFGVSNELFSSEDAIASATLKSAEYLGISHETGSIAKGKIADLAVFELPWYLNADSLSDEDIYATLIYSIDNYKAKAVYANGIKIV